MAHAFLFVDDSALHHQMYRLIFSRGALAGNTLYHATNGREGYALLTQHPELALVFLDLNMPEMNGLEVLARRAAERLHPFVLNDPATTESSEDDEVRARSAGAWDYLRKPFQPADVERLVARALAEAAGSAA